VGSVSGGAKAIMRPRRLRGHLTRVLGGWWGAEGHGSLLGRASLTNGMAGSAMITVVGKGGVGCWGDSEGHVSLVIRYDI